MWLPNAVDVNIRPFRKLDFRDTISDFPTHAG